MKAVELPPLDLSLARPISPGGCPSAGDVEMGSPISWCGSLVLPDRPRTSESRRPSFSASNAPDSVPPNAWRVQPGHYVAFTLNTDDLANAQMLGSQKQQVLLQFRGGRYIGLVVGSFVQKAADNSRWIEDLAVMYVATAPPPLSEAANHYVPIAPFAPDGGMGVHQHQQHSQQPLNPPLPQANTVGGRAAIRTKPLFPLQNRVQWTTFGTRLQIEHLHESTLQFRMDDDEFTQLEARVAADIATLGDGPQTDALEKLRVPGEAVPATVWRDIRGEHVDDPCQFVLELHRLLDDLDAAGDH